MAGRLGDILVAQGAITEEQLQAALSAQGARGMLGEMLVARGQITNDQLGAALAQQFDVPYREMAPETINPQVVCLIPEALGRQRLMAPIAVKGGVMTLAMVAPDDMNAISEAELISGYQVDPIVALRRDVIATLDRGFDERVAARQTIVDIKIQELEEAKKAGKKEVVAVKEDKDAPVVRLVRSILMGAVNSGASDIHLEPHAPQMRVRYRVDGQLSQVMTIPNHTEAAVIGRIKVMADMDTTETRKPQDGNLTIDENGTRASFRVSAIPVVGGEKIVMRVIDEGNKVFTFDALGMQERETQIVKDLLDKPHGMIIMTGPTGSGKTTTMYTMLTNIDSSNTNISTVEDPVEFKLPGINQVAADSEHGMGFSNALKYLMRQDPDVIMIGEIRDHETAVSGVQAALTGHLLISTLHTNDAIGAVPRLNDLGLDYFKIAGALLGVIAQRLLRGLCPHCKEPSVPNPRMLASLLEGQDIKIPADATFYKGAGCGKCMGSGYAGRIPIYEIFIISPEIQKAIEAGLPHSKLRELALKEGMVELAPAGIQQALRGRTTVEEVYYKLSS
ncbi:MAG: Flp pilus assembly complex ATPase component TadA [Planctomycetaceae bacterium]|nr:Flp pilus assembly complex ATPase component TadA [Planctomycetales bacterium]MCB9926055.1 Flp pilus assembly complex ATPase component TadA [Planctomycetaceae bacterium]